jgi:hypothetical protein
MFTMADKFDAEKEGHEAREDKAEHARGEYEASKREADAEGKRADALEEETE